MAEKVVVHHRFKGRKVNPETETLIIGTFNPETASNTADFFYGRPQNHLWRLLPEAFGESSLKKASAEEKQTFMEQYRIDFIDLIEIVGIDSGQEANYSDDYMDGRVVVWRDVISVMKNLSRLKRVAFTRRTLSGIPTIKEKVEEVERYCANRDLVFKRLLTPSRIYSVGKQEEWNAFFR
jgi:G:T/U-mismatch repair DNA glycosylase